LEAANAVVGPHKAMAATQAPVIRSDLEFIWFYLGWLLEMSLRSSRRPFRLTGITRRDRQSNTDLRVQNSAMPGIF
jgi:hypothetical protein